MSPVRMATIEQQLRITLALVDAFNTGDRALAWPLLDPECALEDERAARRPQADGGDLPQGVVRGRSAVLDHFAFVRERLPGAKLVSEDILKSGHDCVLLFRVEGASPARKIAVVRIRNSLVYAIQIYTKEGSVWNAY